MPANPECGAHSHAGGGKEGGGGKAGPEHVATVLGLGREFAKYMKALRGEGGGEEVAEGRGEQLASLRKFKEAFMEAERP